MRAGQQPNRRQQTQDQIQTQRARGGHRSHRPAWARRRPRNTTAPGNLVKLTDAAKRTTTYTYDPANRLTEVSYSGGKPSTVKYEYNKDGNRTKMVDGTGTTKYTYDQLDRLTESENGHKEVIKYEYNLANEQTKITYPTAKTSTRAYDKDGRLEKVTDWLEHDTKFTYDPDSDLESDCLPERNQRRRQVRLQRRRPDDRSQDEQKRGNPRLARLHARQRRSGQKDHRQRTARRRNHGRHLRRKQPSHKIRRHGIQIRRRQQPHQRGHQAQTPTTTQTSSKKAPA